MKNVWINKKSYNAWINIALAKIQSWEAPAQYISS